MKGSDIMARPTELTQDKINEAADQLTAEGKKPSPNLVRGLLGSGSYSTIKAMIDVWQEAQEKEKEIPVPAVPDFAYGLLERLHKEMYIQNYKTLEAQRQQLNISQTHFEAEKREMLNEIEALEVNGKQVASRLTEVESQLQLAHESVNKIQAEKEILLSQVNEQKVKLSVLEEREQQMVVQMADKEKQLAKAQEREEVLQAALARQSETRS